MMGGRWARLRDLSLRFFPERHVYLRSGGEMRTFVLTTGRQAAIAGVAAAAVAWAMIATGTLIGNAVALSAGEQAAAKTRAYYERLIADRQARLQSAVAELSETNGSLEGLAQSIEKRHAALAMLLGEARGAPGAQAALAPMTVSAEGSAADQVQAVMIDQERLVAAAETYAKSRADRLRLAFRLAGLNPSQFSGGSSLGGPLIEAKDPRALAAILDVDEDFAARIQNAAANLDAMHNLTDAVEKLPLGKPVSNPVRSSGYGVRFDPFTRRPAFHAGQDFAGGYGVMIHATAPGTVSFVGQRSGYGNTVEIDHGRGYKTRYAHLQAYSVARGQRVGVGQRIGAMGSTGRSTGVHLHYEIWENGRVKNPSQFLRAGDYVQQN
jgi:murein DD-endopeptidase MepM/ murein hydrolase activator NlpD